MNGEEIVLSVRDGYATVTVGTQFTLALDFHIAPRFVAANQKVRADAVGYAPISVKFVPYYAFANRGEIDMLVWVRQK